MGQMDGWMDEMNFVDCVEGEESSTAQASFWEAKGAKCSFSHGDSR